MAEDAWNTRDPQRVALAYTTDTRWRNRSEFLQGRTAIEAFLTRNWQRELDYRLIKEIWAFRRTVSRFVSPMSGTTTAGTGFAATQRELIRTRRTTNPGATLRANPPGHHGPAISRPLDCSWLNPAMRRATSVTTIAIENALLVKR
jgi:uncharacterized protein (TIGR02246 family)